MESYDVVSLGKVIEGFDSADVKSKVVTLFNIQSSKAEQFISKPRVIKKDVSGKQAKLYKSKLESIGLTVTIKRVSPQSDEKKPGLGDLSLMPTDDHTSEVEQSTSPEDHSDVTCPKCQLKQVKSNQCIGCGIYFHKAGIGGTESEAAVQAEPSIVRKAGAGREQNAFKATSEEDVKSHESLNINAMAAAGAAAVAGMIVWKLITVWTGYELALIAWGIGGAVGSAAAYFGSRGNMAGVVCGLFALCAIFGGKYMATSAMIDDWNDIFLDEDFLMTLYEENKYMSEDYLSIDKGYHSVREFIFDSGYSDADSAETVTNKEFKFFKD